MPFHQIYAKKYLTKCKFHEKMYKLCINIFKMQAQIKKWGNSYGIRLPMNLAKELNLAEGSLLEIEEHKGKIILTPVDNEITIEMLTEGMTQRGVKEQMEDYVSLGLEEEI